MKGVRRWSPLLASVSIFCGYSAERWEISGVIDGTDRITIRQNEARWEHSFGNLETSYLELNGVLWRPSLAPSLENTGQTEYSTNRVNFLAARLEVIEGRDTVALEKDRDELRLSIADTPNGPGNYRIVIEFPASPTLLVEADIDGSDELHVTFSGAHWLHKHWGMATGVRLNGIDWNPALAPTLTNAGTSVFLESPVSFQNAVVIEQTGRGLATVTSGDDGIVINFADSEVGPGRHTLLIAFPPGEQVGSSTVPVITRAELQMEQTAEIAVSTIRGVWYELQYAEDLALNAWSSTGAFIYGNGETMALFDPVAPRAARFYRVVAKAQM